jgi:hypothetical protein
MKMIHLKLAAKSVGKAALWHLCKHETYLAAGAVGVGAGLASKSVHKGIEAGVMAVIGMVGFTSFHASIPVEVDKAIKDGIIEE